jgi:hypothetical protein
VYSNRLTRKNPFHFGYGRGSSLKLIVDKMSRQVAPFVLLLLDHMLWDGSESAFDLVCNFFEMLLHL